MVLDTGSVIMFMYIVYAFFSVLTINDPLFSEAYKPLKIFPYIYLYTMLMIALSPIIIYGRALYAIGKSRCLYCTLCSL